MMKAYWAISLPLLFLLMGITPAQGHFHDFEHVFRQWLASIQQEGLAHFYASSADYPPFYPLLLAFFGGLPLPFYWLKQLTLFFYGLMGFFVVKMAQEQGHPRPARLALLFWATQLALLYNSVIWGQIDAIPSCFLVLMLYFMQKKRPTAAALSFLLAINTKFQALVFAPFVFLFSYFIGNKKQVLIGLLAFFIGQLLLLLPFVYDLSGLWYSFSHAVGRLPAVSIDAFNIWVFLLFPQQNLYTPDTLTFLGMSYRAWGIGMFGLSAIYAFFPWLRAIGARQDFAPHPEDSWRLAGLLGLLFFYVNTEMHERYAHIGLSFVMVYALLTKRWHWAVIGNIAYFLNMERAMGFFQAADYFPFLFSKYPAALLYGLLILGLLRDARYYRPATIMSRSDVSARKGSKA